MSSSPVTPSSPESMSLPVDEVTGFRTKISKALQSTAIKTFAVGEKITPPSPVLSIDNKPVILPLSSRTISEIVSSSAPAPFGRGEDTVVDQNVKHCRQIDATRTGLSSTWEAYVTNLASSVAESLGVYDDVTASLYKLVLYQEAGFFSPHRDTEKEDGMFATLIVQLPCKHHDGGLIVRHRDEEKRFMYSEGSDREYFYTAFYANCENQVLPVRGNRLVLVYNLVRKGGESQFMCSSDVVKMLKDAGEEWEQVKGKPNKLAIKLHHDYIYADLSFKKLKGRDNMVVEALKQSGMYKMYIALVAKRKRGVGDEDNILNAVYGLQAVQEGGHEEGAERQQENGNGNDDESVADIPQNGDDGYQDASGNFKMVECIEESFETLKWIAEDDERDAASTLRELSVDVENELIGDEDLFTGKPDDEDAEITGNEGATVNYFYHRAILVFWPESRHFANMCAGDFHLAVGMFTACSGMCTDLYIDTVIQHAEDYPEEAREYLVSILLTVCKLVRTEAILRILSLFGTPQIVETHPYFGYVIGCDGTSDGAGSGICTTRHADAILEAIKVCGFEAVREQVVTAVAVTNNESLYRCAEFALRLSELFGFVNAAASVARATARQALCRDFYHQIKVEPIAEMMFTLPVLSNLRDIYVTKVKTLHPKVQFQVIVPFHRHCSTPKSFPHLFGPLVKEYVRRTLQEKLDMLLLADQLGDTFEILLGPKPRNEAILESFVREIITCTKSAPILKTILQKPKVGSAVGDAIVSRLADARFPQLLLEKPAFTYRQPEAKMENHPLVEDFLRGEKQKMVYANFENIKDARTFASLYFDMQIRFNGKCRYNAKVQCTGRGRKARVVITKTDAIYKRRLEKYEQDCEEYKRIRRLLTGCSAMKTPDVKRRRLNQGENTNKPASG